MPFDQAIFHQSTFPSAGTTTTCGPFSAWLLFFGFAVGVIAFLYILTPDAPIWKSLKEQLQKLRPQGVKK
jgi:hypothetical protein